MSSVYCTIVMSWERYVRICLVNSYSLYFGDRKFCLYIVFILIFPIIFYIPKFFEVSTYIGTTRVEYKYNFKINHIYRKLQASLGSALVLKGCNFLPPCTYKAIPYCFQLKVSYDSEPALTCTHLPNYYGDEFVPRDNATLEYFRTCNRTDPEFWNITILRKEITSMSHKIIHYIKYMPIFYILISNF